ncbi:putative membrane protein [Wickerhamomyces ciferrii]|uniref:Membrane protein n=1 Tax=Wickerhamomyces ciferrii (strain ATCC 14091 / BCRC 22168 / CBS 111 / JCM 3599 / NBRC 0793 / NRRL Y-1031 F-60-10) TaxID=1206466 RepID=K0KJM9_WICCF|nr:uncharacterized protein BN7_1881 [Wickerhamomyces ciferrii]CCH42337.1 putative membrane protein [Wickerhamomyces ciferrii]
MFTKEDKEDPVLSHTRESKSETTTLVGNDKDEAIKFLRDTKTSLLDDEEQSKKYPKKLLRKIDWRIMTVLCGSYFLQFLDKNLLNYAGVMGIKKNLKGDEFANLGTIFYASYIFAEPLADYFLQVLPTGKFLAFCIVSWGIVVAAHSACHTYASLMIVRTLLGIFESSLSPGLIVISSMWYSKSENLQRTGIWVSMAGLSVIIGGFLSFGFQHVTTDFQSWQIFFLVMGLITVAFGIFTYFILPNNPTSANFLNDDEKIIVLEHIRSNQTGTESKTFKIKQIKELLFHDKHTWPLFFLTIISMMSTGALGTWSVTIIASFGFTSKIAALVQTPVGAAMILGSMLQSYICSYYGKRTLVFIGMCIPAIVAYIILLTTKNRVANLIAIYMAMFSTSVIGLFYSWNSANTAGHTKKLARNGLTMIAFSIGSLIGPQLFRDYEKPDYRSAKITLLVTSIMCIPLAILVGLISKWENNRKDQKDPVELSSNYEFEDLTDIENPNFRYAL